MNIRNINLNTLAQNILASSCVLCDSRVDGKISLCENCYQDLPWMKSACRICGLRIEGLSRPPQSSCINLALCGNCQADPPVIDYTFSALQYEPVVAYLVSQLKFQRKLIYSTLLSDLMLRYLQVNDSFLEMEFPDLILPVPLHKKRLVKRGFNQSLEISRALSRQMGISVCYRTVNRKKNTLPQTDLNAKQRRQNLRNSFVVEDQRKIAKVKHIVILDDVVTTGTTCNELARVLKRAGVEKVGVWSVARA